MADEILTEKKGHIGIITLNRPDRYNTFNVPLAVKLNDALHEFDGDKNIRVIVIKGAGKNFSTGIDLTEFKNKTKQEYVEFVKLMELHNHTLHNIVKPTIASIHGYAVANGAGLSFACDFTIAADNAMLGTTAINIGLICLGPMVPLLRIVGKKIALEMVMTGKIIKADEALKLGLVNKVVPIDKLEEETLAFASELSSKNPNAISLGKKAFEALYDMPYEKSVDYMSELFASLASEKQSEEAVEAFLNKKKYTF